MRVTIAQLEAFFWTGRLGSVQQAARHLNLAQPTVSLRLRDLQRELGATLFERVGRGVRLTHEGEALIANARAVLDEIGRLRDRIGNPSDVSGTVRVGVAETFAIVCLPSLLRMLNRDFPGLRLELVVATSSDLEQGVREHLLDLAFVVHPAGDAQLKLVPLGVQEVGWAASPELGLETTVRPKDLQNIPIITNPPPSAMYRQIMDWFGAAGVEPARLDICTSVTVIAHLVEAGVAVGFLPHKLIAHALERGALVQLSTKPTIASPHVYAAHRLTDGSRAIEIIIHSARQVLSEITFLTAEEVQDIELPYRTGIVTERSRQ